MHYSHKTQYTLPQNNNFEILALYTYRKKFGLPKLLPTHTYAHNIYRCLHLLNRTEIAKTTAIRYIELLLLLFM